MAVMTQALGFLIKKSGMLSVLQDIGRFGSYNLGLTNGGPLDKTAFDWANRLCENKPNATVIEVSVGGLILIAQVDTVLAVTGANMPLRINTRQKPLWQSHRVLAGDVIELGYASKGMRCYLAVSGGFTIKPSFGSSATVCREAIGGLRGAKLKKNDIVPCRRQILHKELKLATQYRPTYQQEVILRTILSYQQEYFSSEQQGIFFSSEYRVTRHNDRMGYRLEGQKISSNIDGILSEGICHGAVQIPANGQPIVLLNDRQTIGGYPKIGSVIALDTEKLAQLRQGQKVRFKPISLEQAHHIFHLNLRCFRRTKLTHLK